MRIILNLKIKVMRSLLFIVLSIATFHLQAQQYVCKTGKAHFFSKTAIEDIEATSNQTVCAINTENQKVVAKLTITTFKFHDKLMEEHFNENYMESDKIPYSTLDAVIKEKIDFSKDGVYDVTLVGTLDLHGVKVPREIKGKLTVKGGAPVSASSDFMVKLADHKIKIPSVVGVNIAEELKVDVAFDFIQYEKK
jgi:hypothetical protein